MNSICSLAFRYGGWLAAALFATASLGFGAVLEGYSHAVHPLALLGAKGMPHALLFNLLAFVLPGLVVAMFAWQLRGWLPATRPGLLRWTGGVGAQLILLSALAFAAQGVFPLDAQDLENTASGRHAAAWMLWWIAFVAGGGLLAAGVRGVAAGKRIATLTGLAAVAIPVIALFAPLLLPAAWAQRLAFVTWFAWVIAISRAVSRSGASASGS